MSESMAITNLSMKYGALFIHESSRFVLRVLYVYSPSNHNRFEESGLYTAKGAIEICGSYLMAQPG